MLGAPTYLKDQMNHKLRPNTISPRWHINHNPSKALFFLKAVDPLLMHHLVPKVPPAAAPAHVLGHPSASERAIGAADPTARPHAAQEEGNINHVKYSRFPIAPITVGGIPKNMILVSQDIRTYAAFYYASWEIT